jgi:phospholipid/cholesterol/gamma-HCH transport system substrate-binding protein
MSTFKAGVIAVTTIVLLAYFGFTKANPFSNPYELHAMFRNVQNLKTRSPVRIAGVEVGKVTKVEPKGAGAGDVTTELKDDALPLHDDARAQIRSRIFLEGNFFVDIKPGSPSTGDLDDGSTLPITQTASTVTLPDILDVLNSDVRTDLQTFLHEYGTVALQGGGAKAFNRAIDSFKPAYRYGALTNDALLGVDPDHDIQRLLRGQQKTFAALASNPDDLKALVTDLNTTAGAIASQSSALEAAVPALRDTLREGYPALGELNAALPTLRTFAREAIPGMRSSVPALDAAIPWFTQARGLVQQSELKGLAADLRHAVPSLVKLNTRLVPFLSQLRGLSSCTNHVLVPFMESDIPSIEDGNSGNSVRAQINRSFVGLAGESRNHDANTPVFHIQGVNPFKLATGKIEPAAPLDANTPPAHRPDVPCETQDPPNLSAPGGDATLYGGGP